MLIAAAQGDPLRMLARHNIHSCLVRHGNPLEAMLAGSSDWKQVYSDDLSVIFIRAPRVASNAKNASTQLLRGTGLGDSNPRSQPPTETSPSTSFAAPVSSSSSASM